MLRILLSFCFRRVIGADEVGGLTLPYAEPPVHVLHLDGCAHKITYEAPFQLAAGAFRRIFLEQMHWNVAYTDNMLHWYVDVAFIAAIHCNETPYLLFRVMLFELMLS